MASKTPNSDAKKATIYVDVEDEITAIIDKMAAAPQKIVALVLPKRATVLQSIVNMRLLKRAADQQKKSLVLITSETGLMPLAASVGVHVAKTLSSKPAIPVADALPDEQPETISDEPALDPETSVGELAGAAAIPAVAAAAMRAKDDEETVELGDEEEASAAVAAEGKEAKPKLNKKLKVPDFDKFRLGTMLAVAALVLLIIAWYVGFNVLPKSNITIMTETSTADAALDITAQAGAKVSPEKLIAPLVTKQTKSTQTGTFQATGTKDVGTKATGTMTVTNCIDDGQSHTVPAGTPFTNGSYSFVSNSDLVLGKALYSAGKCQNLNNSGSVDVTAAKPGDTYNLSARSYSSNINGITGTGSAMSGGTSKILKIVSDDDISTATKAMLAKPNDAAKADLTAQFVKAQALPASESFNAAAGTVITSVKSGDEATGDVNISVEVTYSLVGIAKADLVTIIKPVIDKQIDLGKQKFATDLAAATTLKLVNRISDNEAVMHSLTHVIVGAKIDPNTLKAQIAGMKTGDAEAYIKNLPGVKDATVKASPFYIHKVPKKASRVTVVIINQAGTVK